MEILIAVLFIGWLEYRFHSLKERYIQLDSKFTQLLALLEKEGIKNTDFIE